MGYMIEYPDMNGGSQDRVSKVCSGELSNAPGELSDACGELSNTGGQPWSFTNYLKFSGADRELFAADLQVPATDL